MSSQREIFNKFKAIKSAQSLPPYESPVSQGMDNMNITDFLFELIKQSKGQEGLKNIVLKSVLGELNGGANINNDVFNLIREMFFCFFDIIIPESATQDHNGFIININEIDITNMLSIDPNSPEGRHIYEGNDPAKHLNYLIYTALSSGNTPVEYKKNNRTIFTLSYLGGNELQLYIGATYAGAKLSEWTEDYLQDISFFNMPNFIAQLVDAITGVISIKAGKSQEAVQDLTKIQKVMQKLFGFCKTNQDTSGGDAGNKVNGGNDDGNQGRVLEPIVVSPNTFFENQEDKQADSGNLFNFNPNDILNIQDISDLRSQGKIRFATCGNFEVKVDPDDIFAKLDKLFADAMKTGTTSYIDPNTSQATTAQKYDNSDVVPDVNNTTTFLNNILTDNVQQYADNKSGNAQGSPSANDVVVNLPNMEVEFELNIIKAIPYILTQGILTPQLLLYVKVASLIVGEEENSGEFTIESVINKMGKFITKIGDKIWNKILNNIFNILIKDLTNALSGLVTKYLKQRFADYAAILSFIVNLINGLKLSASGCNSMLDIIMRLLSLNYFGPTPPIPPPLVFVGGMLKPGLNQVSVVNDMKSELANKGIETGAYMSDGTPNYLMAALEVQTNTIIKHIKLDSKIDVMTNGVTGPTIGYGQLS